jgi:O-antigen ligase
LLIVIISYFDPTAKERIVDKTLMQMNLLKNDKLNEEGLIIFSKQHTGHYVAAYKIFLDNKFLGVGVKNFRKFCGTEDYISQFSCSTHPHNTYIQILSETGIIGFLFLMFIFFYFSKYVINHLLFKLNGKKYFTDFEICILSGLLIYLWPFSPNGNVFNNWLNIIMILNLPFLIWSRNNFKK